VALTTLPAASEAATVSSDGIPSTGGFLITYTAEDGDVNDVAISKDASGYAFREGGSATVTGLNGCTTGADPQQATCTDSPVDEIRVVLLDGADHLTIQPSVSASAPAPGIPRILADGGLGDDVLTGGAGNESLTGGPGIDHLNGGGGNDRLDFEGLDPAQAPTTGSDVLNGGDGDDQLGGGPAGAAQDGDTFIGGAGTDTADFSSRTAPLSVTLDDVPNDGQAGEGDDVRADVEDLIGGSDGDTLVGNGAPNVFDGREGDDMLVGAGSDDTLQGAGGNDTMMGGDGTDTLFGVAGDDALVGGNGDDQMSGGGGSDALTGEEGDDRMVGGAGIDTLNGGPGNDSLNGAEVGLVGGDGGDDLDGGPGTDALLGGAGSDRLDGGLGPDRINGEAGRDTLTYEDRTNPVSVSLNGVADDGERREGDNVGNDVEVVLGGTLGDTLTGDRGDNAFNSGSGEDFIDGRAGSDVLDAGDAPDVVWARDGERDRVDCGDDGDLAVVDRRDTVRDCKWTDSGGKRRLTVARSALVRGKDYKYRLPDGHRYYPLEGALKIPMASTIDARDGAVRVATARNRVGARQEVSVSGGPFTLRQKTGRRPSADLRLVGNPRGCSRSVNGLRVPADARVPTLDTHVSKRNGGRTRVMGIHSSASAPGTAWVTEERCNGTFTRVKSGVVHVHDLGRHRTVVLHKGDTYLARAG
jgi:Ca2+-binding RTX toxin-like protein